MGLEHISPDHPLVLVGAGKMGGAMLDGWLAKGVAPDSIAVIDPGLHDAVKSRWQDQGITCADSADELNTPSILIIAVKPQMMAKVLPTLASLCARDDAENLCVISVAAGTTIATLNAHLGDRPVLVRAMPNTPALVGKGAIGLFAARQLTDVQQTLIKTLMQAIGAAYFVSEEADIDAVTALSGSGPAYVFHLVEALAAAGEAEGLAPETAAALARQTVVGAGALLDESSETAEQLRINVTSPKGTTEAGLSVLMAEGGLKPLVRQTVSAARQRAIELGKD